MLPLWAILLVVWLVAVGVILLFFAGCDDPEEDKEYLDRNLWGIR